MDKLPTINELISDQKRLSRLNARLEALNEIAERHKIDVLSRLPRPELLYEMSLLTVDDVAEVLRISDSTVWRLIKKHEIPSVKIGGSVRVRAGALRDTILEKEKSHR